MAIVFGAFMAYNESKFAMVAQFLISLLFDIRKVVEHTPAMVRAWAYYMR
jgi:hypothetical protein